MGLRTWLGLKKWKRPRRRKSDFPPAGRISRLPAARRDPNSISIFRADTMAHTPFFSDDPPTALQKINVRYVSDPEESDIIVARAPRRLRRYGTMSRRFAVWAHEPRGFARLAKPVNWCVGIDAPVHAMTAHNGTIYDDCFCYGPTYAVDFDERMAVFRSKPRKSVMLATYRGRNTTLVVNNGGNIDLNQQRQDLALALNRKKFCDIYGRKWPSGISVSGESRGDGWRKSKFAVLDGYKINIAFESTSIPFYVSEKIWDAIAGATLPVYHGLANRIYDVFPRGSFIEAGEKSTADLVDEILSMPEAEMTERYETCLRTYLRLLATAPVGASRERRLERTARFVESIMKDPGVPPHDQQK